MRRLFFSRTIILTATFAIVLGGIGFLAPVVHAQTTGGSTLIGGFLLSGLNSVVSSIAFIALFILHYFVVIAAAIMSVSIEMTLNISSFLSQVTGVYVVWQTIRDICGLFIIFMLLYASLKLILGIDKGGVGSVGNLIKNIVIAGILINFSFFIVSLLIDASNIVSLAIYKGIVGATPSSIDVQTMSQNFLNGKDASGKTDVNLGNVFMQYLAPQTLYNPSNLQLSKQDATVPAPLQTLVQSVVGGVIMFTIGISFFLAAAAFAARLIILIILLAFSPIWFAAMIFPILDEKKKAFTSMLKGQLIFMPVYLLLLYAAMVIITKGTFFTNMATHQTTIGTADWLKGYIVLAINDFFVIFMINLPLVTAFSMAGSSVKWLEGGLKKFNAEAIWQGFGRQVGSRTLGRAAYSANESRAVGWLASRSPLVGGAVSKGLSNISGAGFGDKKGGYENILKARKKAEEEMHKRIGNIDRSKYATEADYQDALNAARGRQASYRENLPWKGKIGGVIGFMVDNRANRQTSMSLTDEANLDYNEKRLADHKDLEERLESRTLLTTEEKEVLAQIKREKVELVAAIKRATGAKKKKDFGALAKAVIDEGKEEKSGSAEKTKDSGEKPKTS